MVALKVILRLLVVCSSFLENSFRDDIQFIHFHLILYLISTTIVVARVFTLTILIEGISI